MAAVLYWDCTSFFPYVVLKTDYFSKFTFLMELQLLFLHRKILCLCDRRYYQVLSRLVNIKNQIVNNSFSVPYASYHFKYTEIPNIFLHFCDGFYLEIHYLLKGNRHLTKLFHSLFHFGAGNRKYAL